MRLLPVRDADVGRSLARGASGSYERANRCGDDQHLPLRDLSADSPRHPPRSARERDMTARPRGIYLLGGLACLLPVIALGQANRESSEQMFRRIATVLTHPRCLNCHVNGDHPKQGDDRQEHRFRVQRGLSNDGVEGLRCAACHQAANNEASGVPGAANWHLPSRRMGWENRPVGELCRVLKDRSRNGDRSVPALVEHMTRDELVQWAWSPGGSRTRPPIGQQEFLELLRAWASTGAACPK